MNDDYLDGTSNASIILDGVKYEAPAIFKMYDMFSDFFQDVRIGNPIAVVGPIRIICLKVGVMSGYLQMLLVVGLSLRG